MPDYLALKAEIALSAYQGLTDEQIAAALSTASIAIMRNVSCSDARSILYSTGEYGGIVLLSRQTPSETVPATLVAAAITAISTLNNAAEIEASDPVKWSAVQQMLAGFLQAGALSQGTHDALLALAPATTSRAAQLGFGPNCEMQNEILAARKVVEHG